jgi:hypothetical protein
MLAAGLFYRLSAVLAFLGICYVFLLDKALYLNHVYLTCLLAFLMIFLPAGQMWSLDAWRNRATRRRVVPAWVLWLLRFQLAVPYFFGGIAKLNKDWFRESEPLRSWLAASTDFPLIGHHFTKESVARFMSLGAVGLDLLVVPLLLFRRTRPFAYAAAVVFHLMNSRIFTIGIFPWLMIAGTALFFPPDWPRRVFADLKNRPTSPRSVAWWLGFNVGAAIGATLPERFEFPSVVIGGLGVALVFFSLVELIRPMPELEQSEPAETRPSVRVSGSRLKRPVAVLLALWVGLQVLIPLRHLAIPGNVHWHGRGQRYAWMMLVHSKRGETIYEVTDVRRDQTWEVDPADFLADYQVGAMQGRPEMILEFAHWLRDRARDRGVDDVEVRVLTDISFNFGPNRPYANPDVDLAKEDWPLVDVPHWVLSE